MSAPRNARSVGGRRFYAWRDRNYWSVTTIINGGIPKPVLVNWAKKYTATYAVEHIDALVELVKADPDGAVDWLKGAAYRERDRAGDLGTLIHAWIEAHRLGKPMPKCPPNVQPYLRAFEQFVADRKPVYEATEASVYSRTQSYAGTLDAIVTLALPGHEQPSRYVLDAKSGKSVYPEVGLQLAAYSRAEFIGAPDGSEQPMPKVDQELALGLHLAPDAYRLIEVRADDDVFQAFLFAREVFRFCNETSKTILGAEYAGQSQAPEEVAA